MRFASASSVRCVAQALRVRSLSAAKWGISDLPRLTLTICLLICCAGYAAPLRAAELQEPTPIVGVDVVGAHSLMKETLLHYLGLQVGQPIDRAALDQGLRELWSTGLIEDVDVETATEGDGVRVLVRIVERPTLLSVDYQGLERLSRNDVSDLIDRERIELWEGQPLRLGEVRRLQAALSELYRERGFRLAEVSYEIDEVSEQEVRLTYRVDEGSRIRISEIDFQGNSAFSDARLRRAMKKTKESGLLSRILKRDTLESGAFQQDLDAVREVYRSAGYKDVVLGEPRVEPSDIASLDRELQRRLFITIPIDEGQRWKLGDITIQGNEAFSDQLLLRVFEEPAGGWLSSQITEQGVKAIKELYRSSGYVQLAVRAETREARPGYADVVVRIEEGDQFTVGRIEFEGNSKTQDKVVRREIRVQEGEVLNMAALERSLFKIQQLGYFELEEEDPVSFHVDETKKEVDLVVHGEEADRTQLQFGAVWNPEEDFSGFVSVSSRNFLGRGESVGIDVETGGLDDSYSLFYAVPWFLDRPQQLGSQLFSQQRLFVTPESAASRLEETGAALSYSRSLGLFRTFGLQYERKEVRETLLQQDSGSPPQLRQRYDSSSVRALYLHDSRNSLISPTTGTRFSASLEYAGGVLGGDRSLLQPEAGFSIFRPLTSRRLTTVLAFNSKAGWIVPVGGYETTQLEGYFLGGPSSVRGFRPGTLWTRDENGDPVFRDGLAVGGEKFLQLNLEYHLLLTEPVRLVLFGDAGNVYGPGQSPDLSSLRLTAGAELRITVPIFQAPLRFIYATNLDPQPVDQFESFRFSFGTSF